MKELYKTLFSCIDNTVLGGDDTAERIEKLCSNSLQMKNEAAGISHVAAVCVYPVFVKQAKTILKDSDIKVASVAGAFPAGQSPIEVKISEVRYALEQGADEIDMVISRGSFLEGNFNKVQDEVAQIKQACGEKTLKVILETGELKTAENIYKASMLAIEGGADFIKTSTGKISVGATLEAAESMLKSIRDYREKTQKWVGFKAAGGISTPEEALQYYKLAQNILGEKEINNQKFRIGASRLTDKLFDVLL
ncbi:MAG: deoxyribose-phosphate aldolase [Bacteroidales bacterium]|nr:deoxyribose-phosphate aldolase [Bacteroidales bacterium]